MIDSIANAKKCLNLLEKEYRFHDTNAIDVMYSLAMEALNFLNDEVYPGTTSKEGK